MAGNPHQDPVSPFSISHFTSVINKHQGLSAGNKYAIYLNVPKKIPKSLQPKALNLMAENLTLPSRAIGTADFKTNGPIRKIARESIYGEMTVEFILMADFGAKTFFDAWMILAQNDRTYNVGYYDDYIGDLYFCAIAAHQEPPTWPLDPEKYYSVKVEEIFPITVAELGFAYSNTNQYLKCQVTFTYRRWINLKLINTNGNPESKYIDIYKA